MSHNNVGAMLSRTGDLAGALAFCGKALAIQQRLAEANPKVTAFQLELARSHYNIGIVLQQTGDPAAASRPTAEQRSSGRSSRMPTPLLPSSSKTWQTQMRPSATCYLRQAMHRRPAKRTPGRWRSGSDWPKPIRA